MHRIPYWQWLSWTDEERSQVLSQLEGKKWYLDLAGDKPSAVQKDYDEEADAHGITVRKLINE